MPGNASPTHNRASRRIQRSRMLGSAARRTRAAMGAFTLPGLHALHAPLALLALLAPLALLALLAPLAPLALLAFLALLGGCEAELPDLPRGDPSRQVAPLSTLHSGWLSPGCPDCHASAHDGLVDLDQCSICHGPNGATWLGDSHAGWGSAQCEGCHQEPAGHATGLTAQGCVGCHGPNGSGAAGPELTAPQVTEAHSGWQRADCGACHAAQATHGGRFAATSCGACHGQNGGPLRPRNHWLEGCNDCHAMGPCSWNAATHAGFEPLAPSGCIFCHW